MRALPKQSSSSWLRHATYHFGARGSTSRAFLRLLGLGRRASRTSFLGCAHFESEASSAPIDPIALSTAPPTTRFWRSRMPCDDDRAPPLPDALPLTIPLSVWPGSFRIDMSTLALTTVAPSVPVT